jgi:DNA-directed RNA polymerase beta subunit
MSRTATPRPSLSSPLTEADVDMQGLVRLDTAPTQLECLELALGSLHSEPITEHAKRGYNHFVSRQFPALMEEMLTIKVEVDDRNKPVNLNRRPKPGAKFPEPAPFVRPNGSRRFFELKVHSPVFHRPHLSENTIPLAKAACEPEMTPARSLSMWQTYESTCTATMSRKTYWETKEGRRTDNNDLPDSTFTIGSLPVMLGSVLCHSTHPMWPHRQRPDAELLKMGVCLSDPGGYFLVRGQRYGWINAEDDKMPYRVLVRTMPSGEKYAVVQHQRPVSLQIDSTSVTFMPVADVSVATTKDQRMNGLGGSTSDAPSRGSVFTGTDDAEVGVPTEDPDTPFLGGEDDGDDIPLDDATEYEELILRQQEEEERTLLEGVQTDDGEGLVYADIPEDGNDGAMTDDDVSLTARADEPIGRGRSRTLSIADRIPSTPRALVASDLTSRRSSSIPRQSSVVRSNNTVPMRSRHPAAVAHTYTAEPTSLSFIEKRKDVKLTMLSKPAVRLADEAKLFMETYGHGDVGMEAGPHAMSNPTKTVDKNIEKEVELIQAMADAMLKETRTLGVQVYMYPNKQTIPLLHILLGLGVPLHLVESWVIGDDPQVESQLYRYELKTLLYRHGGITTRDLALFRIGLLMVDVKESIPPAAVVRKRGTDVLNNYVLKWMNPKPGTPARAITVPGGCLLSHNLQKVLYLCMMTNRLLRSTHGLDRFVEHRSYEGRTVIGINDVLTLNSTRHLRYSLRKYLASVCSRTPPFEDTSKLLGKMNVLSEAMTRIWRRMYHVKDKADGDKESGSLRQRIPAVNYRQFIAHQRRVINKTSQHSKSHTRIKHETLDGYMDLADTPVSGATGHDKAMTLSTTISAPTDVQDVVVDPGWLFDGAESVDTDSSAVNESEQNRIKHLRSRCACQFCQKGLSDLRGSAPGSVSDVYRVLHLLKLHRDTLALEPLNKMFGNAVEGGDSSSAQGIPTRWTRVFVQGHWLAVTRSPQKVVDFLRNFRRSNYDSPAVRHMGVVFDAPRREVTVSIHAGRLVRCLMPVDSEQALEWTRTALQMLRPQKGPLAQGAANLPSDSLHEKPLIDPLRGGVPTGADRPYERETYESSSVDRRVRLLVRAWNSLCRAGRVEWVDPSEAMFLYIAESPYRLYERGARCRALEGEMELDGRSVGDSDQLKPRERYTHCEIHPMMALGAITNCLPHVHNNHMPRTIIYNAMKKQGLSQPSLVRYHGGDSAPYTMADPQKSLLHTTSYSVTQSDTLPSGQTVAIGICHRDGRMIEDNIQFRRASVEAGLMHYFQHRRYTQTTYPTVHDAILKTEAMELMEVANRGRGKKQGGSTPNTPATPKDGLHVPATLMPGGRTGEDATGAHRFLLKGPLQGVDRSEVQRAETIHALDHATKEMYLDPEDNMSRVGAWLPAGAAFMRCGKADSNVLQYHRAMRDSNRGMMNYGSRGGGAVHSYDECDVVYELRPTDRSKPTMQVESSIMTQQPDGQITNTTAMVRMNGMEKGTKVTTQQGNKATEGEEAGIGDEYYRYMDDMPLDCLLGAACMPSRKPMAQPLEMVNSERVIEDPNYTVQSTGLNVTEATALTNEFAEDITMTQQFSNLHLELHETLHNGRFHPTARTPAKTIAERVRKTLRDGVAVVRKAVQEEGYKLVLLLTSSMYRVSREWASDDRAIRVMEAFSHGRTPQVHTQWAKDKLSGINPSDYKLPLVCWVDQVVHRVCSIRDGHGWPRLASSCETSVGSPGTVTDSTHKQLSAVERQTCEERLGDALLLHCASAIKAASGGAGRNVTDLTMPELVHALYGMGLRLPDKVTKFHDPVLREQMSEEEQEGELRRVLSKASSLVINGSTGAPVRSLVLTGFLHLELLSKFALAQHKARGAEGARNPITGQAAQRSDASGGVRIGRMEAVTMHSHGAEAMLEEVIMYSGDGTVVVLCKGCGLMVSPDATETSSECPNCGPEGPGCCYALLSFIEKQVVQMFAMTNVYTYFEVDEIPVYDLDKRRWMIGGHNYHPELMDAIDDLVDEAEKEGRGSMDTIHEGDEPEVRVQPVMMC